MDLEEQFEMDHLLLQERECRVCGETKNLLEGYYRTRKNTKLLSSYSYECKECTVKRISKRRKERIKFADYNKILAKQNNLCAVCKTLDAGGRYNSFMVDKDPATGAVRGLLCKSCNTILNEVGDNLTTLENMVRYLNEKH